LALHWYHRVIRLITQIHKVKGKFLRIEKWAVPISKNTNWAVSYSKQSKPIIQIQGKD
jgi:hypothetical protein